MREIEIVRGYVLLSMLVYLQIFSLLAVQAVANVVYHQKISRHRVSFNELRRDAITVMAIIDRMPKAPCVIDNMSSSAIFSQDFAWWQRRGCYHKNRKIEYFYVREILGRDDCAVVINPHKQQVVPIYYRNTLLQVSPLNQHATLQLQDTIAVAGSTPPSCKSRLKAVKAGRQMLRWW